MDAVARKRASSGRCSEELFPEAAFGGLSSVLQCYSLAQMQDLHYRVVVGDKVVISHALSHRCFPVFPQEEEDWSIKA